MKVEDVEKAAQDYDDALIYSSISEQCDVKKAFISGVKWFVYNVWHYTTDEIPEVNKHVVTGDLFDFIAKDEKNLKRIMKQYPFSIWAYVEDLLPIKED